MLVNYGNDRFKELLKLENKQILFLVWSNGVSVRLSWQSYNTFSLILFCIDKVDLDDSKKDLKIR